MSLVGTRPPTLDEWEKYELHHRARLAIKPGITGMWQVSGRSDITDFEEVVKLDIVDADIAKQMKEYLWHDDRYCLSSCEKNRDYNTPFARIWDTTTKLRWTVINEKEIGVFMDIFPLDGFPTGDLQTKIHLMRIKMLRSLVNAEVKLRLLTGMCIMEKLYCQQ